MTSILDNISVEKCCSTNCTVGTVTCSNGFVSGSTSFAFLSCSNRAASTCQCTHSGVTLSHGQTATVYQATNGTCDTNCVSGSVTCTSGTLSGDIFYQAWSCSNRPLSSCQCIFNSQVLNHGTSLTVYQTTSGTCDSN